MDLALNVAPTEAEALVARLQADLLDTRIEEVCQQARSRWAHDDAMAARRRQPNAQDALADQAIDKILGSPPTSVDALVDLTDDDLRDIWEQRLRDEGCTAAALWLLIGAQDLALDEDDDQFPHHHDLSGKLALRHPPLAQRKPTTQARRADVHEAVRRVAIAVAWAEPVLGANAVYYAAGAGAAWLGHVSESGITLGAVFANWLTRAHTTLRDRVLHEVA